MHMVRPNNKYGRKLSDVRPLFLESTYEAVVRRRDHFAVIFFLFFVFFGSVELNAHNALAQHKSDTRFNFRLWDRYYSRDRPVSAR